MAVKARLGDDNHIRQAGLIVSLSCMVVIHRLRRDHQILPKQPPVDEARSARLHWVHA